MPVGHPGDEQSETDGARGRRQCRQCRHALEAVPRAFAVHGDEVVETPCAIESEGLTEARPSDDLPELHPLLGDVYAESHGATIRRHGRRRTVVASPCAASPQVPGVGHGQLVAHGGAHDGAHLLPTGVEGAGADGVGQLGVTVHAQALQPPGVRGGLFGPERDLAGRPCASTLAATRTWKRTLPSVTGSTSDSRNSTHGVEQLGRRRDVVRGPPPRRSRGAGSRRRGGRLGQTGAAAHGKSSSRSHSTSHTRRPMAASSTDRSAPLVWVSACTMQMIPHRKRAQHLPPVQSPGVDAAPAGALVGRDELLDGAEPPDRQLRAESPGLDAQPTEVLEGVPEMGQLPVEDGPDAVGPDDQVAVAEVAVHHRLARARRARLGQPAQARARRRGGADPGGRAGPAAARGRPRRRDPGPRREGCGGQLPAPARIGRPTGGVPRTTPRRARCGAGWSAPRRTP